jgi:hypothetical protein
VEVADRPPESHFASAVTKRERLRLLRSWFSPRKRPIVEALADVPEVFVQDLEGTGSLIVTAPAATWVELTAPGGALDLANVQISPNAPFIAADGRRRPAP